ncbi:hypothetical protein HDU97_007626 [Phlyctochytrium planicorne]|nr:hypothetical protein HDU97_007626 [Phlyctochytrium planicorne]
MIDVSGYSKLTSQLAEKGKVSSEIITESIGKYISQLISMIYEHQGDIVKFLGDAVLVTFGRKANESDKSLGRRAALCCLELLNDHSEFTFTLDQTSSTMSNNDPMASVMSSRANSIARHQSLNGVKRKSTIVSADTEHAKTIKLRIHVALTFGEVRRVILGVEDRLDYCVAGDCMKALGPALDNSKSGELGISGSAWGILELDTMSSSIALKSFENAESGRVFIVSQDSIRPLQTAITFTSNQANLPPLPGMIRGASGTSIDVDRTNERSSSVLQKFINKSLLRYILRSDRQQDYLSGAVERAPSRTGTLARSNTVTKVARKIEEYRRVSIVFVKLKSSEGDFDALISQRILELFLKNVMEQDGVFQQFSVDDKGQTMLAVFGLPPWPQKKEQVAAIASSHTFLQSAYSFLSTVAGDKYKLKISIASGQILFSELGNESRRDASLLGDVVNVAARLLSVENAYNCVICDVATMENSADQFEFEMHGSYIFKGKSNAIDVWTMKKPVASKPNRNQMETGEDPPNVIGYRQEQAVITGAISAYLKTGQNDTLFLEGQSGLGKSSLLNFFKFTCMRSQLAFTLCQSSEVDQWTPYFGLRALLTYVLHNWIIEKSNKLHPIRAKPKERRSSQWSSSGGITQGSAILKKRASGESVNRLGGNESADDAFIRNFLRSMDEDLDFAPAFKMVLPHLQISDTDWFTKLDSKARSSLFKSFVLRIMRRWFEFGHRTAIIFDDAQWLDMPSLEVILDLVENCPKGFVFICSRPVVPTSPDHLKKISTSKRCAKYTLEGLSKSDVQDLIVQNLGPQGVSAVEEMLLEAIHSRTKGSPLFSSLIATSIVDNFGETFYADTDGVLKFAQNGVDIDNILLNDVSSVIESQFDKVASVFGQYFDVNDVLLVTDVAQSAAELIELVKAQDTYSFITMEDKKVANETLSNGSLDFDQNLPTTMAFRHISITNCIYETMPYSRRTELHTSIAELFEATANRDSRKAEILPTLAYHYARTNKIIKKVDILEELGFVECQEILEMLIDYVEQSKSVIAETLTKQEADSITSSDRKSLWWSMITAANCHRKLFAPGVAAATTALSLLGITLTKDIKLVKKLMMRSLLTHILLFYKTKGGTHLLRRKKHAGHDPSKPTMAETSKFNTFGALYYVTLYDHGTSKPFIGWVGFEMLNSCIPTAAARPVEWGRLCARGGYIFHSALPALGNRYIRLLEKLKDFPFASVGHLLGGINYFAGNLDVACLHLEAYAKYCKSIGDEINALVGTCMLGEASRERGDFGKALEVALPYVEIAPSIDKFWSQEVPHHIAFTYIVHGDMAQAVTFLQVQADCVALAPPFPYLKAALNIMEILLSMVRKEEKVDYFVDVCDFVMTTLDGFDKLMTGIMNTMMEFNYACCLAVMPRVNHGTLCVFSQRFTEQNRKKFKLVLTRLLKLLKTFGFNMRVPMMKVWHATMMVADEYFTQHASAAPMQRVKLKCWKALCKIFRSDRKGKKLLDQSILIKGMVLWALAVFAPSKEAAVPFFQQALATFEKMSFSAFVADVREHLNLL